MEVSLPISPGVNIATRAGAGSAAVAAKVPSVALPMSFMAVGVVALSVALVWLICSPDLLAGYHYNQNIIALTHLFALGWICSVVMGATYQLVPVALETRLYSERLAHLQFVLHIVGFTGMVWMFHVWNLKLVGHFGSVLGLGVALFVYNIAQTLRRTPKWSVTATAIASALVWISFAVLAGLSIAAAKCLNGYDSVHDSGPLIAALKWVATGVGRFDPISAMHAHAHLGALGCFILLIVGVSYKVIPMFTLSEVQNRHRATASVVLLNLGLAGSFFAILLRWPAKFGFTLLVTGGIVTYLWELLAIVRHRRRLTLDWGIKSFFTAVCLLLPLSLLGLVLSWPGLRLTALSGQLENLYGFIAFAGVITFAIIGMLYKILPFLVWFKSYSRQIGRAQVPALGDMYSEKWQSLGYWTYVAGMVLVSVGIVSASTVVSRWGCLLLALSLATLLLNTASMLTHLFRPKIKPITSRPVRTPAIV